MEDVGLNEAGEGQLVELGILLGDADACSIEVTSKDFLRAEFFCCKRQDSGTAAQVENRPRLTGCTQRIDRLDEKLEASRRGGMVSCSEGHAAGNKQGKASARDSFLSIELLVAIDSQDTADSEWVGDFRGGRLPSGGIKWA